MLSIATPQLSGPRFLRDLAVVLPDRAVILYVD
jgi:hypothetical protein